MKLNSALPFLVFFLGLRVPAAAVSDMEDVSDNPVLAKLDGKAVIAEKDILDRQATQACYGQDALASREAAFMRLLEAAIAEAAMRSQGGPTPNSRNLKQDAQRIDRETSAPEVLNCIKRHFRGDKEGYLRIFVRPAWVESQLRTFILRDAKVQQPAHDKIRRAENIIQHGDSFGQVAQDLALVYSSSTYLFPSPAASSGIAGEGNLNDPAQSIRANFVRQYLMGLTAGQLREEPIETNYDIRLIRLLDKSENRWRFEAVSAAKRTQEEWFQSLPKMKLEITEESLRLWARHIPENPRLFAVEIVP